MVAPVMRNKRRKRESRKAEYQSQTGSMETGGTEGRIRKHRKAHCEGRTGRRERKNRRLSSEMLKRKRTKESGSHAPAPEKKFKRGSPEERLRE